MPGVLARWPGCSVVLQRGFLPATLEYLGLFYVTAPPVGEMTVQQRLEGEI